MLRIGLLALSACSLCAAQLIPRQVLFDNPQKSSARISPDGKLLAYRAPDGGVMNIWVRTLGRTDDHVVTSDRRQGVRSFFWQADSQHILFLQDTAGDENYHLFQTELATRSTRDLTPFEKVQAEIVAVEPTRPDEMLVALNRRSPRAKDVYRLNLKTGELALDTENPGDVRVWATDANLQVRAATAFRPDGSQEIRIRKDRNSAWSVFQTLGPEEMPGGAVAVSIEGKLWVISSAGANTSRLLSVDMETGASQEVAQDPEYDLTSVVIHPTTGAVQAVGVLKDRMHWKVRDKTVAPDFEALGQLGAAEMEIVSRDRADRKWIVTLERDDSSPAFYLYDRGSRKSELLFEMRPALAQYRLAKMRTVSFRARDGLALQGYLTMPLGLEKRAPTILLVHGGPYTRDRWGYHPLVQWLANRGYAVLQINYRGSLGYGKRFLNAGDREWGGKMHDDLIDGKRWAVERGFADPKRVAIFGGSYGGYAALVGLTFTPDEFVCGVDLAGVTNLITWRKAVPPSLAQLSALLDRRIGNPETDSELLRSRSPLFHAERIRVPLLVGHGANDPRVPKAEADQMVRAIRTHGGDVEYILFPDEGHGFAKPQNSRRFWAAMEAFLAKHLGGNAEPPSEVEKWEAFRQ